MIDEKIVPIGTEMTVDWSAFRREAAKDILAGICAGGYGVSIDSSVDYAIKLTDSLIAKLKQE